MSPNDPAVTAILMNSEKAGPAVRGLYELYKSRQNKISITFLCRRAGIPSKGYLAYVMAGERRLNERYWESICAALKLEGKQARLLQLLFEREAEPERIEEVELEITQVKAALN